MTRLLPVAERELRVASRRRGTYWVRCVAALWGILVAGFVLMTTVRLRAAEQGQVMFVALAGMAFAYCLLSGVLTTSDSVSEEKRDGTLGLLFLTNLRGYDVVAGKLVASSARAVLGVVALLPVIALPILMGGVSARAAGLVALVLGNTLFLSLVIGLWVSVVTRDVRQSIGWTLALLVGWTGVLPLLRILWIEYGLRASQAGAGWVPVAGTLEWVLEVNPVFLLQQALDGLVRGGGATGGVVRGLLIQHLLGWVILVVACLLLPRSWRDSVDRERAGGGGSGAGGGRMRSARWVERMRQWRAEVLDWEPFAWVVMRERRAVLHTWCGLAVVAGVWMWGYWEVRGDWLEGAVGLCTLFTAGVWLKGRMAGLACRHLHEHRRSGALELVLSTPLSPELLVRGNLRALWRMMSGPVVAVCTAGVVLCLGAMGRETVWSDRTELPMTFFAGLGVMVLDLVTLGWAGMWWGFRSGRYLRGYYTVLGLVMVLPWVLFIGSLMVYGVMVDAFNMHHDFSYPSLLGWWVAISVAVDLWLLGNAQRGLGGRLRELAAEPHGTASGVGGADMGAGVGGGTVSVGRGAGAGKPL